jgi:hypothetical protein
MAGPDIANRDLPPEDTPPPGNDWRAFTRVALSIRGYDFPGSDDGGRREMR